jgi:chemotaxis-related protein WspB
MLFLTFKLGQDRYAIEAAQVVEVLPLVNWKCIPGAPPGVAGIIDYHGTSVPLVDLMELALGKPSRKWMSTRILLVTYGEESSSSHVLGLLAEQATQILRRNEADFTDSGVATPSSPYLGPVTIDGAGIIQRVEVKHILTESMRSQLFPARVGSL